MEINTEHFKQKLLEEKETLEKELGTIGRVNPDNPSDWEAVPTDNDGGSADPNDRADAVSEYEENTALLKELEIQLKDVKEALEKIEKGEYGICEVGGETISPERLEANPSARTCTEHMN